MRVFIALLLAVCVQFRCIPAFAQAAPSNDPQAGRPKIALVLSGGGARGYSHIGVLKVLEQLRIPVDMIVGTSMGAVVGGLYSTGLSAEDLEAKVSSVNLGDVAFDRIARKDLPQGRREDEVDYPISVPAGFDDRGGLKLPRGFVRANSLLALLQEWTASTPPNRSFDRLAVPFRAVATDIESGERVVFDHGSLPIAIRASMAAPGLFSPIEVDGRTLIDGGIVDNLPVDVARELGADVMIVVHIGTPLRKLENIKSPADVAQQMIGILIGQNVRTQKASLREQDVLISPDLGDISFTDFTRAPEAIKAGVRATDALRERLSAFSLAPADYAAWRAAHHAPPSREATRIDAVDIVTSGRVPDEFVQRYLDVQPGDTYDAHLVNERLAQLQTTGYFESISHDVIDENGVNHLRVKAIEKSWGPNFLLFGIGLTTDFDGGGGFQLNIGHRRPWITKSGLEWRNDVSLGDNRQVLHTELRQPVFGGYGFYVSPYAEVSQRIINYYGSAGANARAQARPVITSWRREALAGLDLAMPLAHLGEMRLGVATSRINEAPRQSVTGVDDNGQLFSYTPDGSSYSQSYARARIVVDQLDDALFPRSGYRVQADAQASFDTGEDAYRFLHGSATGAASLGRHTLTGTIETGVAKDSGRPFSLGGFRHLAAYGVDEFSGSYVLYGNATYQYQLAASVGSAVHDLYLGSTIEVGNASAHARGLRYARWKKDIGVFVGATTALGPAYLGYAIAPGGVQAIYLQFGASF
jgi:NTE family protein